MVLCERGIRTFETSTRSTLDVSAVPVLIRATHLPVIVDPSHAAGIRELVIPLALAAAAAGADGLIVEVHPRPSVPRISTRWWPPCGPSSNPLGAGGYEDERAWAGEGYRFIVRAPHF